MDQQFLTLVKKKISLFLTHFFSSLQQLHAKLKIDVYYESKCPDSRNFMLHQLKRIYPKVKDKVELNYIPFGKAYVSQKFIPYKSLNYFRKLRLFYALRRVTITMV